MNAPLYIARGTDIAARRFGEETMIMSGKDSELFSLNETASLLWQAADGVTPLAQIVERQLCAAFDVDAQTALRDAEELARQLAGHGILRVSDQPLADTDAGKAP
ncbi:MAG TPA: PqqD family protein [Xanthomonadaceae bacterium]|jgi:hypothetical protein|nr:PqqD family protein [Xanthomonadaceae bacterium]